MRNKAVVISFLTFLLSLAACQIDSYDKGEGDYSLMTAELVDAYVGSDRKVTHVLTDQDEQLTMKSPFAASWIQKADTTYRAALYYNKVENGMAEAVSLGRVGVLLPQDSIKGGMKADPLYAESIWMSKNRKYLNLRLRLLTGSTDDAEAAHTVGLLRDTLTSTATHLRLMLYHNQGGRPEYYSSTAYASIPLTGLDADSLTLHINTYDGVTERTFPLHP